jgi:hypothetical protein
MLVKGAPPPRTSTRAARATFVLVAALAVRARPAMAHPEFSALGVNRYVTAAVFDGRVDVTDALLEGTLASGDERRRLDADGDGQISDAERRAGEQRLATEGPALSVEVDGRALVAPMVVAVDLGDEPRANAAPVVIERRLSFPAGWPPGARRLRLVMLREPPRVLDTEIGVVLGPGFALASAGRDLVTFRGPRASTLEERVATFDIAGPPPAPARSRRVVPVVVALSALALALAARRRARRSARS